MKRIAVSLLILPIIASFVPCGVILVDNAIQSSKIIFEDFYQKSDSAEENKSDATSEIPEEVVDALIKFAKRLRFGLTLIEEKEGHINMIDERVISAHEKYGTRFPQPRTFPDHYDRVVYQAIAYCDAFDESLFLPHLKDCKTARWDEYAVYIMPKDCDKASGVMATIKHFNLDMKEALCIGDDNNDIEMVSKAGIGIAMGNAIPELKEVADYVTDNIDNDGFAKAMLHYGLIDEIR